VATAIAAEVTGGILFAFSTFVMPALRRLPSAEAVRAMQAINLQAPRSLLMLPLIGSALGCLLIGGAVAVESDGAGRVPSLVGAVTGLAAFLITAGYHVPRNNALGRLDPDDPGTDAGWKTYYAEWTRWNHVRSGLSILSGLALTIGALRR
jgi:uncharacterized membrane protein